MAQHFVLRPFTQVIYDRSLNKNNINKLEIIWRFDPGVSGLVFHSVIHCTTGADEILLFDVFNLILVVSQKWTLKKVPNFDFC